jgi:hypothetical protein
MRTMNGEFRLDLEFHDALRSRPIVECLERHFVVTRVRGNGSVAWVRVELDDVRKADALRRFGARHGFNVVASSKVVA